VGDIISCSPAYCYIPTLSVSGCKHCAYVFILRPFSFAKSFRDLPMDLPDVYTQRSQTGSGKNCVVLHCLIDPAGDAIIKDDGMDG